MLAADMQTGEISFKFGDVRDKSIVTPNHFVSHMIEHIAWRMGMSLKLNSQSEDWKALGENLGKAISKLPKRGVQSSCLGMIDDGGAIVDIDLEQSKSSVSFTSTGDVDLDLFLNLRCEQIKSGKSLIALAEGLASGLNAKININICSLEDTHHTWEGVYRAIGIALSRIYTPDDQVIAGRKAISEDQTLTKNISSGELSVLEAGINRSVVRRGTAETGITLALDMKPGTNKIKIDVDPSIQEATAGFKDIFEKLSTAFGINVDIDFKATVLSSSHVVMEDIGLVFGRALLEILKQRMEKYGVNAAGSNVKSLSDHNLNEAHVALSVEGRKFWRLHSENRDSATVKKNYILGIDAGNNLRGEDLDDFIDGLTGGMSASVIIVIKDGVAPKLAWESIFSGLGTTLKEAFDCNPYRKGVPPGVKATLA